eukprot:COSAG01_NODE_16034_length_1277_cov_1.547154_2_plen_211_part_00
MYHYRGRNLSHYEIFGPGCTSAAAVVRQKASSLPGGGVQKTPPARRWWGRWRLPATCQPPAPPRPAASVLPGAALGGTASPRLPPPSRSSAFRANDSGALSGPASLGQLGQRGIQPVGDRSRLLGPSCWTAARPPNCPGPRCGAVRAGDGSHRSQGPRSERPHARWMNSAAAEITSTHTPYPYHLPLPHTPYPIPSTPPPPPPPPPPPFH